MSWILLDERWASGVGFPPITSLIGRHGTERREHNRVLAGAFDQTACACCDVGHFALLMELLIHTMNESVEMDPNEDLIQYQTNRLQDLTDEIYQCCQAKTAYLARKCDMHPAEVRCLMLFRGERYLTVKGLAQKLEVAKSRVTKLINGLMEKKLIESMEDPRDGRIKLLSLTQAGRARSEEIASYTAELHRQILMELGPEQRKGVLASLELFRSSMEGVKKQLV